MSTVDWVLLACVLASMLLGAWRGLVYEVLSLLGWLVAFVVARIWAADVALWLPMQDWDMQLRYAAGFVLLFVLALFGWGLVSWLSRRLIEAVGLRPVDRTLGQWWQDSALAPWLMQALAAVLPQLPQEWGRYLPAA